MDMYRHLLFCLLVFCIKPSNENSWDAINFNEVLDLHNSTHETPLIKCVGNNCGVSSSCPGLNEQCDNCCQSSNGEVVFCYQNKCQICYKDSQWKCSSHSQNQDLLMTATQITMSAALMLGIITIFVLFWKICTGTAHRRPRRRFRRRGSNTSGRSTDTLQQIVSERLRDAPPPYSRSILPPPGDTPPPYVAVASSAHVNPCLEADYNVSPPSYSAAVNQQNSSSNNTNQKAKEETNDLPKAIENPENTLHI